MNLPFRLLTILFSAVLLVACGETKQASEPVETESLAPAPITIPQAEQIFDYAYPLVIMKISQDVMFTVPFGDKGTINDFMHFKRIAGPKERAVVLANRNTHYSVGWVDLSEGPVLFEIPDMGDRYYVMPLLDAWSNTFASLGSRTTGQGPQRYALTNQDWSGEAIRGYEHIISPTNMVWITGRIQADSHAEKEQVAALQDGLSLQSLDLARGLDDPFAAYKPEFAAIQVRKPVPFSLKMQADKYYDTFFAMWANNGSPIADQPIVDMMEPAGISRGTAKFAELSPEVQAVLAAALKSKQEQYLKAFYEGSAQTEPWIFNIDPNMGNWGTEYERRAYWSMWGLGANIAQDAVYGVTQLDQDMQALNGQNVYKIHFEPDTLPPTNAFWSVTLYDEEGYMEPNDHDCYDHGSNHDLAVNDDGSIELIMSHEKPASAKNWIPAPKENFKILLRIYWPDEKVLKGEWNLPAVKRLK
ncbi:MAG: DUF1254 domain-containing protein [Hellea sp.]|nr:DUF1254 domain-containing protein [Hellea sp.]